MTPRQRKRLSRASVKGRPLVFIRRRVVLARMSAAVGQAFDDMLNSGKRMAEAIRDNIQRELISMVLRPIVARVVKDVLGAAA